MDSIWKPLAIIRIGGYVLHLAFLLAEHKLTNAEEKDQEEATAS